MKTWSMICLLMLAMAGCNKSEDAKPSAVVPEPDKAAASADDLMTPEEKAEVELNKTVGTIENLIGGAEQFGNGKQSSLRANSRLALDQAIATCTEMIAKHPNDPRLQPLLDRAQKVKSELKPDEPSKQESDTPPQQEKEKSPQE